MFLRKNIIRNVLEFSYEIVLIGVGESFSEIYPWIQKMEFRIADIWDNNQKKWGHTLYGYVIEKVSAKYVNTNIHLIITSIYFDEIKKQLIQMGYTESHIHDSCWLFYEKVRSFYDLNQITYHKGEKEAVEYIKKNGVSRFNINLSRTYKEDEVECVIDKNINMYYILHCGKKMYVNESYSKEKAICYYNDLRREQDKNSPHCYANFIRQPYYDCVVDAGCCEGFFSLDMINKCDELYIIEPNDDWFQTYKYTFNNFSNLKIHMIKQALGSRDDGENYVTLDLLLRKYLTDEKKILIKMDIEGAEEDALYGASKLLSSNNNITIIVCAYHHADASERIEAILKKYKFNVALSNRNMFFNPNYEMHTINHSQELIEDMSVNYRLRCGLVAGYKAESHNK